jgi:hypothetical protein
MDSKPTAIEPPLKQQRKSKTGLGVVLGAFGKFTLQFVLPLLIIGPVMLGAEKIAELLGFHGTEAQFIRIIMLGVYALIIFKVVGSGKRQ